MSPAQFNELQRQADVIEQNAIYQQKLEDYKSSGLSLSITKDALSEFTERIKYKTWNHLYLVHCPAIGEKYEILFHKKCLEYQSFISDIFSIGATYGIKFALTNKQTKQ